MRKYRQLTSEERLRRKPVTHSATKPYCTSKLILRSPRNLLLQSPHREQSR
jgi:hypothetical protein